MFVLEINDDGYLGYPNLKIQPPLSNRHLRNLKPQEMNSNFTNLRNVICVLVLSLSLNTAFAQNTTTENSSISNLKATVVNNNIVINWNVTDELVSNYCEVQASKDGKTFSTIGLVLGADPSKNDNSFAFKQNLAKMKAGQVYYRVVMKGTNDKAATSTIVKASI